MNNQSLTEWQDNVKGLNGHTRSIEVNAMTYSQ